MMEFPRPAIVEERTFSKNRLVLPEKVWLGVQKCLISPGEDIRRAKSDLLSAYRNFREIPKVDYEDPAMLDAYTIDYLPRYFSIPRIGFRDLALSKGACQFDDTIHILDIGSGTGAVSLGVFDLFSQKPFSRYGIKLLAIDRSKRALTRQSRIIKESELRFEQDTFDYEVVDATDFDALASTLDNYDPWDVIISANFMNELSPKRQIDIVLLLSDYLAKNGSIMIFEPAQDRGKVAVKNISNSAQRMGLKVYYPCGDPGSCPKPDKCWVWREYGFSRPKAILRNGVTIAFSDAPLKISSIILNKNGATIFDEFEEENPEFEWGTVAPVSGKEYEVCSQSAYVSDRVYARGSIVGYTTSHHGLEITKYRYL